MTSKIRYLGQWVCMICKVLNFALDRAKQVVLSTLVFSYDEQERFDSQLWYCPARKLCFVALYGVPWLKEKKQLKIKSTPTWSPGHASLTKTVTESIPLFCSQRFVPINKASFLFTDPPTIPAVCSTLVMCFLCPTSFTTSSSPCHRPWWWNTLLPKKGIKLNPSATFDVLNWALMLPPTLQQKCILLSVY